MKKELPYIGARLDQTEEQIAKNYKQSEVVASVAPVLWVEKKPEQFIKYPIRNQDGSGQCVAFTYAKELSILFQQKYSEWKEFSTVFPYQLRTNPNISGCSSTDIYSVFPKVGNIFDSFMTADNMNDTQAMSVKMPSYAKDLAKMVTAKRISIPLDFDTVASTIQQTGKGVMLWFHFNSLEWKYIPVVSQQPTTSGHSVCGVDVVLYKGIEYIVCDESWGNQTNPTGQRLISREYFNMRCYLASYLMNFKFEAGIIEFKPKFDGTIISLQKCLKFEGLFPQNIPEIESQGPITTKALIEFQKKYNIEPAIGVLGPFTKAKLFSLYP